MRATTSNYLIILLLLACFTSGRAQPTVKRPNILWIVSEDNSPLLGAYGDAFATTPNLDHLATEGVLYENAFATAPVCAPARSTLITGVYPTAMGTQHMRSTYPIPDELIRFFPKYLRENGYYTTNNAKKDYNTADQPEAWDESGYKATYKNRKPGQPFFAVFNTNITHESSLHTSIPNDSLHHDPEKVPIPPYHPATPAMKHDWAQYYDKIEMMDEKVGEMLQELKDAGLADSTIVFYYSDHGGALGRSKRFMYESGLHIPLIIRFPSMYASLAPGKPGSRTDRMVTFVDFAPTVLSLAGIDIPAYMQGKAFLGKQQASPQQYAFAFRGRMDERIDMSRSVRDKQYRYIRNYMPHRIYAQYLEYLWRAPSMPSWEDAYRKGETNKAQSAFWQTKPAEELYDVAADPHNIHNLAEDQAYRQVMNRMREANQQWEFEVKDVGFLPEAMIGETAKKTTLYDYARSGQYHLKDIMETADMASAGEVSYLDEIIKKLQSSDPAVRYWAATGCTILGKQAAPAREALKPLLKDKEVVVRIAAAEALYQLGEKKQPLATLEDALSNDSKMARLQALNVLENMKPQDIAPAKAAIKALVTNSPQDQDYDVRAADRLVEQMQK